MRFVDRLTQVAANHMRIDLRGGNVGMTEHRLHAAKVRAAFEQMCGEAVADDVRRQGARDADFEAVKAEQLPKALAG